MRFLAVQEQSPIMDALRGLCAYICQFVYTIMAWTWSLLLEVADIRLLNSGGCNIDGITRKAECLARGGVWTDTAITLIYKRFTLLLGIIMTFYIIFQFIKYLMTPEEIEDKEKGIEKLGFRLFTVVALLALTPTLFDMAYGFQKIVLDNQILSKLIIGTNSMDSKGFGRAFSSDLLSNFYYVEGYPTSEYWDDKNNIIESQKECSDGKDCVYTVVAVREMFKQTGELSGLHYALNSYDSKAKPGTYFIHFDGLFALVVGIFIAYMLIMYTIDVGARVIQLTFLQIIAPIPIIAYLSPKKDGTFQKWLKQCGVTYVDLFIRLLILFFTTLIITKVSEAYQSPEGLLPNVSDKTLEFYVYLILIIGLITFCKRAPKMVQELFPSMGVASGTFGLKPGDRPLVSNAIGMLGGATTGLRTLAMRAASQVRRNRDNRDLRKEAREGLDAKKKDVKKAKDDIRELRKQHGRMDEDKYKAKMAELKQRRNLARAGREDARVAVSNTRYRSATLAGLGGLVGGTVRGAAKGATLNEIKGFKDFRGKMQEVEKSETQRNTAIGTWYDEGGRGGIIGTAQRTAAGVESKLGLETPKARMEHQVRTIDSKIKANDAYANIEANTKSKRDEVENRLTDRISKGQLSTEMGDSIIEKTITNQDGTTTTRRTMKGLENYDLSEILTVQELSDHGNDATEALRSLKFGDLAGRYTSKVEEAKAKLKQKVDSKASQAEIDAANAEVQKALDAEKLVMKFAMRRAFDHALKEEGDFADAVTYDRIKDSITAIEVARSNSSILNKFDKKIEEERKAKYEAIDADTTLTDAEKLAAKNKFESDVKGERELFLGTKDYKNSDYDELDAVVIRLNNIANDRKRENQKYTEDKRKIEASYRYDAAKANDAFNSSTGGGKK